MGSAGLVSEAERARHGTFVLASPPLTSGARTLGRVKTLARTLDLTSWSVTNLFSLATRSVRDISVLGIDSSAWLAARSDLESEVRRSTDLVLAFGVTRPSGRARSHFLDQLEWLATQIEEVQPTCWSISDSPRHPSRWQRYTHRAYPDLAFEDALDLALTNVSPGALRGYRLNREGQDFAR